MGFNEISKELPNICIFEMDFEIELIKLYFTIQ